jgi:hypothetical protein
VIGFGVFLWLFDSEIAGFVGVFEVGLDEGVDVGSDTFGDGLI